jgi:DNA-binding SARP family transcriptional activator/TolB-like protein
VAGNNALAISRRGRGILCYLALARDRKATRERLCNLFWQDRGATQARASLRQTLLELRAALPEGGPDLLIANRQDVALDERYIRTDLEAAEAATDAQQLLAVMGPIGAEPLIDMQPLGPAFDQWRLAVRPLAEARLRDSLIKRIDASQAARDHASVIGLANAWARRDPLDERVAARAVAAEIESNARGAAEQRYRALSRLMESELGTRPDAQLFGMLAEAPRDTVREASGRAEAQAGPVPERSFMRGALRIVQNRYGAAMAGVAVLGAALALSVGAMRGDADPMPARIAVLPFTAQNGNDQDAIFAAGLSEEIMDGLAQNARIAVLGRVSALSLSTTPASLKDAGAKLGVSHVLTGTLRYSADRSRVEIAVDLKDARSGSPRWSRTVRRNANDVASAEHELVDLVLRTLTDGAQGGPAPSASQVGLDPGAYTRIVLARRHILSREGDQLIEARELAREAVRRAPQWAEAHAVLSIAASLMQNYTDMPEAPLQAEALAAAEQAIALDPDLPTAQEARSLALEVAAPAEAMAAARQAVRLRPGNAEYRRRLAWLLKADGRPREAAAELEEAIRIDPLWHLAYIDLGMSLSQMNAPDRLIAAQARFAALKPPARERELVLANMLLDTERAGEAAPVAAQLVQMHPDLTYAALTWIDSSLALFATQDIPPELFELNTDPLLVALSRGDTASLIATAVKQAPGVWDAPEDAVILGYALLTKGQSERLRTWHMAHYRTPQSQMRGMPQTLALGRHPNLYAALAFSAAGDAVWADAVRKKIEADIARLEQLGLAKSRSGLTVAALAAMKGDKAAAIDRLEAVMSAQWSAVCHGPIWIGADPLFRSLDGNPRFTALQQRCRERLDRQRAKAGLAPVKSL